MDDEIKSGSIWQHRNGLRYTVLFIANERSQRVEYPTTVVYTGPYGRIWARSLADWRRSMTKIRQPEEHTHD